MIIVCLYVRYYFLISSSAGLRALRPSFAAARAIILAAYFTGRSRLTYSNHSSSNNNNKKNSNKETTINILIITDSTNKHNATTYYHY